LCNKAVFARRSDKARFLELLSAQSERVRGAVLIAVMGAPGFAPTEIYTSRWARAEMGDVGIGG